MVELEAYAADCRVFGQIDLVEARLTDQLTLSSELLIRAARLESLADGHAVEMPELSVNRDDLCAVVASGPRGNPARRLRTRPTRVAVDVGPYHVEGALHGTPAAEPLGVALRRGPWVPLTEVTFTYRRGAEDISEDAATLIVNHDWVRAFRVVGEQRVAFPWETPRTEQPALPSAEVRDTERDEARPDHPEAASQQASEPEV